MGRNQILGISDPALARIARGAGVHRIAAPVYAAIRTLLRAFLKCLVDRTLQSANAAWRRSVTLEHVRLAVRRMRHSKNGPQSQ